MSPILFATLYNNRNRNALIHVRNKQKNKNLSIPFLIESKTLQIPTIKKS